MTPSLLSPEELERRLEHRPWRREGDAIVRELELPDFGAAIELVNRVAAAAEQAGHHPDILVHSWNRLRLSLSTHSAGGITAADLDLAEAIDRLA